MKNLLTTLLLFTTLLSYSQERVGLSVHQDIKLATIGDQLHNYDAFTTNIVARLKMQGNQQKYGYMIVFPEFEYADLRGDYKRYSANVGYTFNRLFLEDLEVNAAVGYGWIDRNGGTLESWSLTNEIAYKLSKNTKLSILNQYTDRRELKKIVYSLMFGLEIGL